MIGRFLLSNNDSKWFPYLSAHNMLNKSTPLDEGTEKVRFLTFVSVSMQ